MAMKTSTSDEVGETIAVVNENDETRSTSTILRDGQTYKAVITKCDTLRVNKVTTRARVRWDGTMHR